MRIHDLRRRRDGAYGHAVPRRPLPRLLRVQRLGHRRAGLGRREQPEGRGTLDHPGGQNPRRHPCDVRERTDEEDSLSGDLQGRRLHPVRRDQVRLRGCPQVPVRRDKGRSDYLFSRTNQTRASQGTLDFGLPSCRFHASSSYARTARYRDSQGKSSSLAGQMGFDERTRRGMAVVRSEEAEGRIVSRGLTRHRAVGLPS